MLFYQNGKTHTQVFAIFYLADILTIIQQFAEFFISYQKL